MVLNMFRVNNKNARTTLFWSSEQCIQDDVALVFLLLALNIFHAFF